MNLEEIILRTVAIGLGAATIIGAIGVYGVLTNKIRIVEYKGNNKMVNNNYKLKDIY